MRLLLLCLLLLALGVVWRSNLFGSVGNWWQQSGSAALSATTVEDLTTTGLLVTREKRRVRSLLPDDRLHVWLEQRVGDGAPDVGSLADELQEAFPEYQQIAVFQAWQPTSEDLAARLSSWTELGTKEFTHMAVHILPSMWNLGWKGWVVIGQKLPPFSPEALANPGDSLFYSVCGICGKGQSCQIPRHTRSLSLECSHCQHTYAMIASGSDGTFRYVNEYLTGYAPRAHYARSATRLSELMSIWHAVSTGCRYTQDTGTDDNDAWQTARETQVLGQGDCEDTAILLADWLLVRGFEARVALGRYAERGGHAWVVVRLEGQTYLLESTEGASSRKKPPLLRDVGSRYIPETLFDREALYTRQHPLAPWNGDFWGEMTWLRVNPRQATVPAP